MKSTVLSIIFPPVVLSQRLWQNIWIFLGFCTHIVVKCVLHLKLHGTHAQQSGSRPLTPDHMRAIGQPIAISPEDFRASCVAFKSRFEKKKKDSKLQSKEIRCCICTHKCVDNVNILFTLMNY